MSTATPSIENTILSRVVNADEDALSPEAARGFLTLKFPERDRGRMAELAERARQGELTAAEQQEAETYERIGSFLGLLQSKARLTLTKHVVN